MDAVDESCDLLTLFRANLIAQLNAELASPEGVPLDSELSQALQIAYTWANRVCRRISIHELAPGVVWFGGDVCSLTDWVNPINPVWHRNGKPVGFTFSARGWVITALNAVGHRGDRHIAVKDASAILSGRHFLRNETSAEEIVVVSSASKPRKIFRDPAPGSVPLSAPLQFEHLEGTVLTDLPPAACKAIVSFATALLCGQAMASALDESDPYPDTPLNASSNYVDPWEAAPALVTEAERLITQATVDQVTSAEAVNRRARLWDGRPQ
ncbi:hypothetical protein [Microtetraspora malaysiensis]|uniref:hypothetical protein n=1 Tax=Microtetraspora malaysiensis TaxID=161358 RepID=UPI003D938724